ncbi:MAG: ATP-grasp domain-containing protein [Thermoplasmatota archaeon]
MASQILLATCPGVGLFHDDEPLVAAFAHLGVVAEAKAWQEIDGSEGAPVLIRTPWDYAEHRDAFLAWLDRLDAAGVHVLNPPALMHWNLDKRYLLELQRRGVDIVPTELLPAFEEAAVREVRRRRGWRVAIAKPTFGAGATGLVRVDEAGVSTFDASGNTWMPDAAALPQGPCLVQPLLPEVEEGEWSLFYFGGAYSHAVLKRPAAGDIRVQEEHGGRTEAATPSQAVREAADRVMAAVPEALYGRVDGVVVAGRFLLMELELVEPELYFRYAGAEAPARLAEATLAALQAI